MIGDHVVFQFEDPHQVGTVCGFPCAQCGDREMGVFLHGTRVEDVPMRIVRVATQEEWLASIDEMGGDRRRARRVVGGYYYEVAVD